MKITSHERYNILRGLAAAARRLQFMILMLAVLSSGYLSSADVPSHGKKVVGYFIEWGVYARDYMVKDMPADKLTHVNFAFLAPFMLSGVYTQFSHIATNVYKKSDGSYPTQPLYVVGVATCSVDGATYSVGLAVDDTWACFQKRDYPRRYQASPAYGGRDDYFSSWDMPAGAGVKGPNDRTAGLFGELLGMKNAYPHIKVVPSIGGWSYSYYFGNIARTNASRRAFAVACQQTLNLFAGRDGITNLFDGIDLDWEFPYAGGDSAITHDPNDKAHLTELCKAVREQIGPDNLLTIATAQNYQNISNQYDAALQEYLDAVLIMAYDYNGYSWSPRTGFNAPLFGSGDTNDPAYNPADGKYVVIAEVVQAFLGQGFNAANLVLGLPFYGRTFGNVADLNHGQFQSFSGPGIGSYENGVVEFNDICDGGANNKILSRSSSGEWSGINGYTRYWDATVQSPFLYNGNCWVSYDDDVSLAVKTEYALTQGLGGVMIWDLSCDTHDRTDMKSPDPYLLISAIDTALRQVSTNISAPSEVLSTEGTYTNKIRISWQGEEGATAGYQIWRSQTNDPNTAIRIADIPADVGIRTTDMNSERSTFFYDDYDINPITTYYYWVRAKTTALIKPMSYVAMGYAALDPNAAESTADIAAYDFVYLPVNATNLSPAGTISFRVQNLGPDALNSLPLEFNFHMGTNADSMAWIGSAQSNLTLVSGSETLVILPAADKSGIAVRGDLSGVQQVKVTARHLDAIYDPNLANNTTEAAGTVRVKSGGVNSIGRGLNDYDGDGKADLAVYNETLRRWFTAFSGERYSCWSDAATGGGGLTPAPGDYDGDGITDLAVYDAANGLWTIQWSSTGEIISGVLGGPEFAAAQSDWDGDTLSDPVVYREADGLWLGAASSQGYALGYASLGGAGYQPVIADYDGDGLADPAVYDRETGRWMLAYSGNGYQVTTDIFGGAGYEPAPADYDGDGLADPAVFEAASGKWQVLMSGSEYALIQVFLQPSAYSLQPVPADYDGDGKADFAVYLPATPATLSLGDCGQAVPSAQPMQAGHQAGLWQLFLSAGGYREVEGFFGGVEYRLVSE